MSRKCAGSSPVTANVSTTSGGTSTHVRGAAWSSRCSSLNRELALDDEEALRVTQMDVCRRRHAAGRGANAVDSDLFEVGEEGDGAELTRTSTQRGIGPLTPSLPSWFGRVKRGHDRVCSVTKAPFPRPSSDLANCAHGEV
jgi:hypothetical protein